MARPTLGQRRMTRTVQFRVDTQMQAALQQRLEHYLAQGVDLSESQLARALLAQALEIPLNEAVANEIIMGVARRQAQITGEALAALRDRIAEELG